MDKQSEPIQDVQYVYVIQGRNQVVRDAIYTFLTILGLQPIASLKQQKGTPFMGEVLETAFGSAKAIIVLFTGEERVRLRQELQKPGDKNGENTFVPQPGMDQIFKAGYALNRFPERTILIQIGQVKLFSDIDGRYMPNFTGKEAEYRELIERLREIGCVLKEDGKAWQYNESFQQAFSPNPSKRSNRKRN